MTFSIVTVAMNRTEHLQESARAVAGLRGHDEHVILDFGSSIPIRRDQLPSDERIKLHRVESPNGKWWLTHSYNLAFSLAQGDYILKLDADILPSQRFFDRLCEQLDETKAHLMCNRLTRQDWHLPSELFTTNGLFLCKRSSLSRLSGFNPYIQGWGWDEIDLYSRFFLGGFPASRIPRDGLYLIEHGDELREEPPFKELYSKSPFRNRKLEDIDSWRLMRAHDDKNRCIAVASVKKNISWPTFDDYYKSYKDCLALPLLPAVSLFEDDQKRQLYPGLARQLINPPHVKEVWYRVLRKFRRGPYSQENAKALLDACGIDFSLVSDP